MQMTQTTRSASSSRSRVAFIIAMLCSAIVLVGTAVGAVSLGVGPLNTSLSVGQISNSAHLFVIVLVIAAVAALLFARTPRYRLVAIVAIVAFVLIIVAAFYALSRADNPDGLIDTAVTDITNPQPDFGFYLIVIGAIGGLISSIVIVADRRSETVETASVTEVTQF